MGENAKLGNAADLKQMVRFEEKAIFSRAVFREPHGQVLLFCLAPGEELLEHTAAHPAVVHVLEGSGVFEMEGDTHPAKRDMIFHLPARLPHAVKAEPQGEGLVFLLTMFFRQESKGAAK